MPVARMIVNGGDGDVVIVDGAAIGAVVDDDTATAPNVDASTTATVVSDADAPVSGGGAVGSAALFTIHGAAADAVVWCASYQC